MSDQFATDSIIIAGAITAGGTLGVCALVAARWIGDGCRWWLARRDRREQAEQAKREEWFLKAMARVMELDGTLAEIRSLDTVEPRREATRR